MSNRPVGLLAARATLTTFLLIMLAGLPRVASAPASGSFDFSLSGGTTVTVPQGASTTITFTAILSSGSPEPVEFVTSPLPTGTTYLFSKATCNPTCTSTLTIRTSPSTPPGPYPVTVRAVGAGMTRFAPFGLRVTASAPPASSKFTPYSRVRTRAEVTVHSNPSTSGAVLGVEPIAALGRVMGGPVAADGLIWWNVAYDGGASGWSREHLLAIASDAKGLRGDCSSEAGLANRHDIVFCEPWEDPAWWQNGYVSDGSKTQPRPATPARVDRTAIVATDCISGHCLEVKMLKGESGALALHWPLTAAGQHPDDLYLRYYIKLSADFDPSICAPDGRIIDSGGKLPGLADVRTNADPGGQCGNGGNPADGLHCWSMRSSFRNCYGGSSGSACSVPGAVARFGHYAYFYRTLDFWGVSGHWDRQDYDQSPGDGGTCRSTANNMRCGIGNMGNLVANRWYRIEIRVRMNTPGQADGVLQGWVDGTKAFDKANMIYRLPGHDDLHVRTAWLNVHTGGDYPNGNCADKKVWLDQMVLATGGLPGPWRR